MPASSRPGCRPSACCRNGRTRSGAAGGIDLVRDLLAIPAVHARMQHLNGEAHRHRPQGRDPRPSIRSIPSASCGAPSPSNTRPATPSGTRATRARCSARVDIPVYLAADWDNVPLHLPSTFTAWAGAAPQPQRPHGDAAARRLLLALGVAALRGAGLVRPLAEGPRHRHHGRPADPLPGAGRRRLADGRRLAAARGAADAASPCAPTGSSAPTKATPGQRAYLYLPAGSGVPANANPPDLPDLADLGDAAVRPAGHLRRQYRAHPGGEDHRARHRLDRRPLRRAAGGRAGADHRRLAARQPLGARRGAEPPRRPGARLPPAGRDPCRSRP